MDDSHDEYVLSHETRLRYFWLSDNVCYDVFDRLTHVIECPGREVDEDWNWWAIYNDKCVRVWVYKWWGIFCTVGDDSYDDDYHSEPCLERVVHGEIRDFDLYEHMYRLFDGNEEHFVAWNVPATTPDDSSEQVLGELVLLKCYRRSWCGRPDQKNMGHDPHCGHRYQL